MTAPKSAAPKSSGYLTMIEDAIKSSTERTISSRHAIDKIVATKKGSSYSKSRLNHALRRAVETGKLVQVKGSFKLSIKKAPASKSKTVSTKKPIKKAATASKKKPTTVKSAKKATKKKPAARKKATTKKPAVKKVVKKKSPAKKKSRAVKK